MLIRHEINILNGTLVSTTADTYSNEGFRFIPGNYSGSCTLYIEVVATNTSAVSRAVHFSAGPGATSTVLGSVSIPASTTSFATFRASVTYPSSSLDIGTMAAGSASGTLTVKAARAVILQDTGGGNLTASETQVEVGNRELAKTAATANTYAFLTAPKYWKYDKNSWDGNRVASIEIVWARKSSTMNTVTLGLLRSKDLSTWVTDTTVISAAATSLNAIQRTRVNFTPTDGAYYAIAWQLSGTTSQVDIYSAKVIIQQAPNVGYQLNSSVGSYSITGTNNAGNSELVAQPFVAVNTTAITGVKLNLYKNNAPTDNLTVELVSTLTGSALASGSLAASSLTTTPAVYTITFSSSYTPTAGSTYYIRLSRSGAYNTTDFSMWSYATDSYIGGVAQARINGTWGPQAGAYMCFELTDGSTTEVTKLEEQYLLGNTVLANNTSLQNFLSKWDPADWSSVDNTYVHQVDAAASSTAVVEVDNATPAQVSGSSVAPILISFQGNLDDNYPSSNNSTSTQFGSGANKFVGQSFTPSVGKRLSRVGFYLRKAGSPTGTMVAKLYAHTGTYGTSSLPTGTVLATSNEWDVSLGTAGFSMVYFDFSTPVDLTAGTQYVVGLETSSGDGVTNYIDLSLDSTSPTHGGNTIGSTDLATYTAYSAYDTIFYSYMSMTMPATAQNLDVKMTTATATVYSSRVLVRMVKSAGGGTTTTTTTTVAGGRPYTFVVIC